MANGMTQRELILDYIEENGSITPLEALREFGCMRLAAVICKLREMGYIIHTEYETKKGKTGRTVRFAKYVCEYEDEGDED